MRNFFLAFAAFVCSTLSLSAQADKNGHVLTSLWKEYEEAAKADRPVKEAELLAAIRNEALQKHLPVDFYDAATAYVETVQRRDWKQRNALRDELAAVVKQFDEPIVTFLWMAEWKSASSDALWAYVKAHLDGFAGRTPAFYRKINDHIGGALLPYIASDKEYVLWRLFPYRSYISAEKDEVYQALKAEVGDRYPNAFCLEYSVILKDYYNSVYKQKALYEKWKGKAVAYYPLGYVLQDELRSLQKDDESDSEDYKEFYDQCAAHEKKRSSLKGEEARIAKAATGAKDICETLLEKDLSVEVEGRKIVVVLRNLADASLVLTPSHSDEPLHRWSVKNPKKSFYVRDSVVFDLPALPDDDYQLTVSKGKNLSSDFSYAQYTLSLATRKEGKGWGFYLTDYITGEPLDGTARVALLKNSSLVASEQVSLSADGFTPLPGTLLQKISTSSYSDYELKVSAGDRASQPVSLDEPYVYSGYTGLRGRIYRDRGAYNPGDKMQFKVILFQGDAVNGYQVLPDQELKAILYNTESKEVESLSIKTGEFGSADGSFVLPKGMRNGYFSLSIRTAAGRSVTSDSFRVDEFVLPTFTLDFDSHDQLYLRGDVIPVTGRLTSYSGHPLKGASLHMRVENYGYVVEEADLTPDKDNAFATSFKAQGAGYYRILMTVTDATGETQEFSRGVFVTDDISLNLKVENAAPGEFLLQGEVVNTPFRYRSFRPYRPLPDKYLLTDTDKMTLLAETTNTEGTAVPMEVRYKLYRMEADTVLVQKGVLASGSPKQISVRSLSAGLYRINAECRSKNGLGESVSTSTQCYVLKLEEGAPLPERVATVFVTGPETLAAGEKIHLNLGAADGAQWTVVSLFGEGSAVLENRLVRTDDLKMTSLDWAYDESWPDAVRLVAFGFKNGHAITFDREFRRGKTRLDMPLSFTRFEDRTAPGTAYTFTLKTDPSVEALVAVWDKSIDAIARNEWPVVSMRDYSAPSVSIPNAPGIVYGHRGGLNDVYEADMMLESAPVMMKTGSANSREMGDAEESAGAGEDVVIRSTFENALAFEPHLRPDAEGNLSFSFRTSDKMSTYYVSVYVHDKTMRNALLQQETVVSLPLKVSIVEPSCLYAGDTYEAAVTLTNMSEKKISGNLQFIAGFEGANPLLKRTQVTTVPAGESVTVVFPVKNLALPGGEESSLILTATFKAKDLSDGLRLSVPVYPSVQQLSEAHSAVLHAGEDREALLKELRSRFVNVDGALADVKEITILDMVKDAIPGKVEPSGKDVLSLSEAWYMRLLSSRLLAQEMETDDLLEQILACRNADGGFGWFEGMRSSPAITAVVLERMAKLRDRGFADVPDLSTSAAWLDRIHFSSDRPSWYGCLTHAQYMRVRALYPSVAFDYKPATRKDKEALDEFKKYAAGYLTPEAEDGRGLKGAILSKARRLITLRDLATSGEGGLALAKAWGIGGATKEKLTASMEADLLSLSEYAVSHRDGGWYFPNAVMPWRGLLESEAYAHSLLCDLFSEAALKGHGSGAFRASDYVSVIPASAAHLSDGVRLWLMIQKETQHWDTEPAFVDAVVSILDGSGDFLQTRVLALSASYSAPFRSILPAGNGFTIERRFIREVSRERLYDDKTSDQNDIVISREEIQPGMAVNVGDKILVEYRIHNDENRSFVKLTAGREGCFRPKDQLSGFTGWHITPMSYTLSFSPQGYRNVGSSVTEYYFDAYPEEDTVVTEEMFVTQAGRFTAPVVTIESLYAPHYRANSGFRGSLAAKRK